MATKNGYKKDCIIHAKHKYGFKVVGFIRAVSEKRIKVSDGMQIREYDKKHLKNVKLRCLR